MTPALTPVEVAARLRLSVEAVRRMIRRGDIPAYRAGRGLRVLESTVREYECRNAVHAVKPVDTTPDRTSIVAVKLGGSTSRALAANRFTLVTNESQTSSLHPCSAAELRARIRARRKLGSP